MKLLRVTPLLLFATIIGLASCKKGTKVTPSLSGKSLVLTAYEQQKVTADNAFSLRLFKSVDSTVTDGSNVLISPLSASFALGMTSNGAQGSTFSAFQNTLGFNGLTQTQVNTYYNNLITNLPQLDPNTTLDIANSVWYKQGFSVLPQFLQTDSSSFHAQIQSLDFASAAAPQTINKWVSNKTNGYIPTIISSIPSNAVMYLVNALYFKSAWKEKFDPSQTQNLNFYLADNSTVQAPFMTGYIDLNYYADSKAYVYELPYSNNKFSMVIVEPVYGASLANLMPAVDPAQWQTWMSSLQHVKNEIMLPKLKYRFGASLNQPLINMGLGVAFTPGADFLGINPNASYQLHINQVVHEAYIETDESGTTAAGATSVGVVTSIAPAPLPAINRPFLFAIREMSSGVILFMGRVNTPLPQ